ncbi:uncharacterized protein LOC123547187 [Mercenaria mercenaria]|uniref:uncharacterized protein LOC123547187 n=1 Tax=Mercenaria mercenaria TaxID=6596 RepID=UPI001E1DF461|nr:uncharacterized protein LOC123547187 [Mercenaria mercenaria]
MAQLTEDQEKKLKLLFDNFDEDKSGSLNARELRKLAQLFDLNLTEQQVAAALDARDIDRDGVLDFDELKTIFAAFIRSTEDNQSEMIKAFETLLKKAGLGEDEPLTKKTLFKIQKGKGEDPMTKEDVAWLFSEFGRETTSKEELAALFCC